jgi:hypothetical protein
LTPPGHAAAHAPLTLEVVGVAATATIREHLALFGFRVEGPSLECTFTVADNERL